MTRIKRCISVIVLAAFTVMLLAGCREYTDVSDLTSTWKTNYELQNLTVLVGNGKDGDLAWEAYLYARNLAGYEDKIGDGFEDFVQVGVNDINTLTTGNYRIASDDGIATLKALDSWVAGGNGTVGFIVYSARSWGYVIGVSVTVPSTSGESSSSNTTDEPASSSSTTDEPASSGCTCTDVDDTDTYCANCLANNCDFGVSCNCH